MAGGRGRGSLGVKRLLRAPRGSSSGVTVAAGIEKDVSVVETETNVLRGRVGGFPARRRKTRRAPFPRGWLCAWRSRDLGSGAGWAGSLGGACSWPGSRWSRGETPLPAGGRRLTAAAAQGLERAWSASGLWFSFASVRDPRTDTCRDLPAARSLSLLIPAL